MTIAKYRSWARILFFAGAMLVLFGIGFYLMGDPVIGVLMAIVGMSAMVIGFTIVKFFLYLDFGKR
ncbi:MAG: hypothetical protein LBV13_05530 [Methanomassiliicoccaceae archaeon]|jgi:drug/metabolite transporter (DMT)-like permease|nr:hypothetical protein [Methanomassiliicoccaceae archaeon]